MSQYWKAKTYMIAMVLLIIGGLNWGVKSLMGKDFVTYVTGRNVIAANAIFGVVGLAALFIGFNRDSYLPFLGKSLIPCEVLKPQTPENADISTEVQVGPGVKVLYWAAESANKDLHEMNVWKQAYLGYRNAGVAVADESGIVTLKVRKPQPYSVPIKGTLSPHIHYRKCKGEGLIGRVNTIQLNEKEFFENYVSMQETKDPVTEKSAFNYVKPAEALAETRQVTLKTLNRSLMPQGGAPDEANRTAGTPVDNAFMAINTPLAGATLDAAFTGKGY
jgi:uncharacterized membrane protein YuzA (DUF378 family)